MSQYTKALQSVDEIEQLVGSAAEGQASEVQRLSELVKDVAPNVEKLRKKASETDPSKALFGPNMCAKVLTLAERWDLLQPLAAEILQRHAPQLAAPPTPAAPPPAPAAAAPRQPEWVGREAPPRPAPAPSAPTPTAAERREAAARAAEARLQGPSVASASSSSGAAPASSSSSQPAGAAAQGQAAAPMPQPVLQMEALLHLVHCTLLQHGFSKAAEDMEVDMASASFFQVRYTHQARRTIRATYVPVQRHLVVYASEEAEDGDAGEPTRVALQLGMTAASVQAKADYLLVSPLLYRQCVPALQSVPPEPLFGMLTCLSLPGLGSVTCASRVMSRVVSQDDVLWWQVLIALPPNDRLKRVIDSAVAKRNAGEANAPGEYRLLVKNEVQLCRADAEAKRRAREEMERARRQNPLMIGQPRRPNPLGDPFGGGMRGGRGIMGGDYDLMPGGLGGFPGRRGDPFGGGGGGFGGGGFFG
eukprot:TRINITY_DN11777_c0_g1_i1.p1 TRINITY_DN11777_c0_g1~~TRINITY_DN11777_c0_g1_i1.p1  ORF type:complete len:503 (+),score=114.99 TRINITY_DN11777_c0_g1_i1:87-1511(+)